MLILLDKDYVLASMIKKYYSIYEISLQKKKKFVWYLISEGFIVPLIQATLIVLVHWYSSEFLTNSEGNPISYGTNGMILFYTMYFVQMFNFFRFNKFQVLGIIGNFIILILVFIIF